MSRGRTSWYAAAVFSLVVGALAATAPAVASSSSRIRINPDRACYKCLGQGVSALSPSAAWIAGFSGSLAARSTWMRQWNGRHWHLNQTPNPGGENILYGVDAVNSSDAWSVGYTNVKHDTSALIAHYDGTGTQWSQATVPAFANSVLYDVSGTSPSDVWAVGNYNQYDGTGQHTLVLHYDGSSWTQVPSPDPDGTTPSLKRVSADSASDAWALGTYSAGNPGQGGNTVHSVLLHWNGSAWTQVASPSRYLQGISAISPSDVWAVGTSGGQTDTEHWNGSSWTRVPSPNPGGATGNILLGVSARATGDVWAVGTMDSGITSVAMILHWDGTSWTNVPCPSPDSSFLSAVSADASNDAWAIGIGSGGPRQHTLIEHWDGTSWTIS